MEGNALRRLQAVLKLKGKQDGVLRMFQVVLDTEFLYWKLAVSIGTKN